MALSIGELVGYVDLDSGPAEAAADRIGGMFDKLGGTWGKALGVAGGIAGGLFATGVVTAVGNEVGSDKLAASLGGGAKLSERYGRIAGDVYANGFGEGLEDVNTAMGAVVSSIKGMRGASDAEVQAMTERAMTYADVMGIDVTRAAQVAGNMVVNGLAKNGEQAFDLLMKASQKVPVQLREDVLDATDEYGQFFTQLGIDGPQAMGMLAAGAAKGMYGIDKAGDAVKEFTIRSTDMSTASVDAYKAIGLDAGKMANAILAGGDKAKGATDKIIDGLLSIKDPAKRANASIALFGTPLEDLSVKDIPKFLRSLQGGADKLGKFSGSVDKAGDTAYDNAATNLSMFGRTLKTEFVQAIGGKVLPVLGDLTGMLANGLGPALSAVGRFLSKHSAILAPLAVALGVFAGAIATVVGVTKLWRKAQLLLNLVMAANPIVLVVAALVALGAGLVYAYKKSETFRKIVDKAFSVVKKAALAVGNFFTKKVPAFFSTAWDKVKSFTTKGVAKVVGFIRGLPGKAVSALGSLRSKLTNVFGNAMDAARSKVANIGGRVVDWIKSIPGKLLSMAGRFGSAGKQLLQGFIDGMKNAAGIIGGIAGNVWDAVKGLLNGAIGKINAALEFTIKLPGPDLRVDLPNIPQLATGARATGSTLAVIGEGREPESVLPDSVLRGLLERAHAAGRESAPPRDGGRTAPLIGQVVQSPGESTDTLAERLWFKTRTRG